MSIILFKINPLKLMYNIVMASGIRQLQCILLKVALLIGVEVHVNVAFDEILEPPEDQTTRKYSISVDINTI